MGDRKESLNRVRVLLNYSKLESKPTTQIIADTIQHNIKAGAGVDWEKGTEYGTADPLSQSDAMDFNVIVKAIASLFSCVQFEALL